MLFHGVFIRRGERKAVHATKFTTISDLFLLFSYCFAHGQLPLTSAFLSQIRLISDWTQSFGSAFTTPLLTKVGRVLFGVVVSFAGGDEGELAGTGPRKHGKAGAASSLRHGASLILRGPP